MIRIKAVITCAIMTLAVILFSVANVRFHWGLSDDALVVTAMTLTAGLFVMILWFIWTEDL